MSKQIFVNVPVKDLPKSIAFFEQIGFTNNPRFTDETAACMVFSDAIHVMLLTHKKFREFTSKDIADAFKTTEALIALAVDSRENVDAMVETGIMVDSSVVKGLAREAPYQVDFRQAEGHRDWWVADRDDVSVRGSNGSAVLECPVYSFRGPYLLNFMPAKLWAAIKRKKVEKRDPNSRVNAVQSTPGLLEVARKVFGSHVHTLDFCKLSAAKMSRIVAREQAQKPHGTLVFIGHSKDFWNDEELDGFLRKLCRLPGARVCTFDELLSRVAEGPTSDDGARD